MSLCKPSFYKPSFYKLSLRYTSKVKEKHEIEENRITVSEHKGKQQKKIEEKT